MPRATAAAAAETARQVRASAARLFADQGFAEVTLDDVAREAGVTRGAVYHHYGTKPGLFRAVASDLQAQVADAVVVAAESAGPEPGRRLRAGCHAFLEAVTADTALRVLLVDAPAVIGWQEWRGLDEANSQRHLREALAEAGVAAPLLGSLTAQLSGAMNEAALWVAEQPDPRAALAEAGRALDLLLHAALP